MNEKQRCEQQAKKLSTENRRYFCVPIGLRFTEIIEFKLYHQEYLSGISNYEIRKNWVELDNDKYKIVSVDIEKDDLGFFKFTWDGI